MPISRFARSQTGKFGKLHKMFCLQNIMCTTHAFLNVFVDPTLREASHIDFDHEKCHMDVGGGGGGGGGGGKGGLVSVTFLGEKLWKISIVCLTFLRF